MTSLFPGMALVNVSVVSDTRTVSPWKIMPADPGKESIRAFYERRFPDFSEYSLAKAFLGRSKDSLDHIDLEVEVQQAVSTFGPVLKYIVIAGESGNVACCSRSVSEVLMAASKKSLPAKTTIKKIKP